MSAISSHIESFINGNIRDAKAKLLRRSHRELREAYRDATGCGELTAAAFADFIKGDVSFQQYCDTKHENGEGSL